jgi:hypothetical protein
MTMTMDEIVAEFADVKRRLDALETSTVKVVADEASTTTDTATPTDPPPQE